MTSLVTTSDVKNTFENSIFNRFVEKQLFLERADLRRFEIEKAAREKARKALNR